METTTNNKKNIFSENHSSNVSKHYIHSLIHNKGDLKMKNMKRKAVSDIIATLLLMGITVAGAVLVATFFQGNAIFRPDTTNSGTQTASIKIVGYDTRDGTSLSDITNFDNTLDAPIPYLRTNSTVPNNKATDVPPGNEFIVLTVRNQGINSVELQSVELNGVEHSWDPLTGNTDLLLGTQPKAGKFSILPSSTTQQSSTNEIQRNGEARLVVKLSDELDPIYLNQPIRTKIITNLLDPSDTIITSGGVR